MGTSYNQETILITEYQNPQSLHPSIWSYPGCENDGIYAEITMQYASMLFRVDGGNPYASHSQYGLQFCEYANQGDVIVLENISEIAGFRAVKRTNTNCLISVIYYKA
jgi:hypothetical protein